MGLGGRAQRLAAAFFAAGRGPVRAALAAVLLTPVVRITTRLAGVDRAPDARLAGARLAGVATEAGRSAGTTRRTAPRAAGFLPSPSPCDAAFTRRGAAEARRIEAALPRGARRVALDERGERVTTAQLAERLLAWQRDGRDAALLIGGPDGLDPALKASCDESLRLSDLTLPHAFARVLVAEALYRAWSVTAGHPYHRE